MCKTCWQEAGSPTERTPETDHLVELIVELYEIHAVGGPLHAVLDDYNLDGLIEPWYDGYDDEELVELHDGRSMRQLCDEIAGLLNAMTEPQRYAAVDAAQGADLADRADVIIEQLYVNNGRHPWRATAFTHHFPIDGLKIDSFDLTCSDYNVGDDQIVCPCGEVLYRFPGSDVDYFVMGALGWAIKIAREHLAEAHGMGS